jgi:hypothetical protein
MTDDAFEAWKQRAAAADIHDVATRLLGVKFAGRARREMAGPCPRCGGEDRFSINTVKQVFLCRGAGGGNVVSMAMHVLGVEYLAACEVINGEAPPARGSQLTGEAIARAAELVAESRKRAERRDADQNAYRAAERERTADMYNAAHPFEGSSAADYMALRGLTFPPTPAGRADRLRCIEALPYVEHKQGKEYQKLAEAPAMVARIVDAERKFRGIHITYLDLAQPKGKLQLVDPATGKALPAKKVRGSKQGNHVELIGPREPRRLVLGEGIEKTVAVWMALDALARPLDDVAFWSSCDLGNLAGPAKDKLPHPTLRHEQSGRAVTVDGLVPDFDKPAIAIPASVAELVLLGDTTSDAFTTQLAMCRAAARYARPGLTVRVAWPPAGVDFDDLWRIPTTDAGRADVARRIVSRFDDAGAPIAPDVAAARPGKARRPKSDTAAPASDSEHQARQDQTSAGAAGAPIGLHLVPADADAGGNYPDASDTDAAIEAALGPAAPLAAAPAGARFSEKTEPSRMGASGNRGADRGKWGGPGGPDGPELTGDDLDRALAMFPQTDLGNAERCAHRFRHKLKYSPAHGWLAWNGRAGRMRVRRPRSRSPSTTPCAAFRMRRPRSRRRRRRLCAEADGSLDRRRQGRRPDGQVEQEKGRQRDQEKARGHGQAGRRAARVRPQVGKPAAHGRDLRSRRRLAVRAAEQARRRSVQDQRRQRHAGGAARLVARS